MAFDIHLLDEAWSRRIAKHENDRKPTLAKVFKMLEELGKHYDIAHAWVLGSVTRPQRFTEQSDVDIAVEQINPTDFSMRSACLAVI
ncbi:MAG: hypothetical protein U0350_02980 [Caldilineaceae bacterium]